MKRKRGDDSSDFEKTPTKHAKAINTPVQTVMGVGKNRSAVLPTRFSGNRVLSKMFNKFAGLAEDLSEVSYQIADQFTEEKAKRKRGEDSSDFDQTPTKRGKGVNVNLMNLQPKCWRVHLIESAHNLAIQNPSSWACSSSRQPKSSRMAI